MHSANVKSERRLPANHLAALHWGEYDKWMDEIIHIRWHPARGNY
jgi:hypothetical protein